MKKSLFLISAFLLFISSNAFCDTNYSVQKGDTLYSISKRYQITVAELRAANNLKESDVLKAGQKLVIPEADIGTAAALSSKPVNTTTSTSVANNSVNKTELYTVQKGDTLYGISKKNNMTVAQLLELNGLDSNAIIKVGQKLKIYETESLVTAPVTTVKPTQETSKPKETQITITNPVATDSVPDTRTYGVILNSDSTTKWPVKNPTVTQVKGKVSGVQLSASNNESVTCIHEGTVMFVGTYRGFGQVVFVQSKTGLIYAYTGLGSVSVKKSDYAVSGAQLGTAGVDSISGNSQITLMVFQNGQPIDPRNAPRN